VLGINEPPVTIKVIEHTIIDHAWEQGWIVPEPPSFESGKRVAVIGAGPAGLAAAQQLRRAGHAVTVFEKADRPGLLRYGIPISDGKEPDRPARRPNEAEGLKFELNAHVGGNVPVEDQRRDLMRLLLAGGAEAPRYLRVPGRELLHSLRVGIPAPENRRWPAISHPDTAILAEDKNVIIIGGGDTGADCLGTSHRQKARSVRPLESCPGRWSNAPNKPPGPCARYAAYGKLARRRRQP
jgi:glutamate synthase (NADPH/NADH) small chain